jgi:hypothetical protein
MQEVRNQSDRLPAEGSPGCPEKFKHKQATELIFFVVCADPL